MYTKELVNLIFRVCKHKNRVFLFIIKKHQYFSSYALLAGVVLKGISQEFGSSWSHL